MTSNTPSPTTHDRIADVAQRVFGWSQLRPGQSTAIEAVVDGHDVLAVMPTGYGKSAVYQIAGHLLDGPTVVVSPLIALQADQVQHIVESTGRPEAVAINSARSSRANRTAWLSVASGEAEFVFLAPEQFAREEVVDELRGLGVSLFVVDEAHCVSSWGFDFRPDYLRLGGVIERLGGPRILALTATGSAPVRDDIVERLGLRHPRVFVHGFDRPNVHLAVVRHESEHDKQRAVLAQVTGLPKPGLVYVATHSDTTTLALELSAAGLRAAAYHGGLPAAERERVHGLFHTDDLDVVVATSAFGMGIDKPDVRFVVHADVTDSIDSYYQEVGRSGRDGAPATATLHYRAEDLGLRSFFASGRPDEQKARAVAAALRPAGEPAPELRMPVAELTATTGLAARSVENIVNLLVTGRVADENREGVALAPGVDEETALAAAVEAADQRRRIDESRVALIRAYAETLDCRRQFLLGYFGDDLAEPCGNCDTCESGTAYERQAARKASATGFAEGQKVRHAAWGAGQVVTIEGDRVTVFFDSEGYKVLSLAVATAGGLLTPA
ncbi:RecQ family ATP-dependent DNA helicase [Herbiconiux daphne]|uniref:ATP-dependent DNA helicase RecQ n=1 Tax=Herbiconiux daphne TaxID=2970914 RepID=A0ABT2H7X0_9MICO|nr:RecQ family ATP-dependent DNA helicase [Herbiconiux daphne]MCS5736023.1 RecQ family ATP-dependent DNA helicase [Herbiconiux daphne]